jgi:AcrR family transcriptional regulator
MSHAAPDDAGGDPKQRLLERALGYLSEHGIGDISLRELAAALGTSHRMLIYHFGSKEGLFVAVVQEADRRQRRLLASSFGTEDFDLIALGRHFWRQLRSPEIAPLIRLFFELYAHLCTTWYTRVGGGIFPPGARSCRQTEHCNN